MSDRPGEEGIQRDRVQLYEAAAESLSQPCRVGGGEDQERHGALPAGPGGPAGRHPGQPGCQCGELPLLHRARLQSLPRENLPGGQ